MKNGHVHITIAQQAKRKTHQHKSWGNMVAPQRSRTVSEHNIGACLKMLEELDMEAEMEVWIAITKMLVLVTSRLDGTMRQRCSC